MNPSPYANFSKEELIARIQQLERKPRLDLRARRSPSPLRPGRKPFDFNSHPQRKIALKFCYSGWEYSGLAIQEGHTPLPTVEAVLFSALAKTRLIDPEAGMEGCGWSRCGRTDSGVSAAGQVISLWVRSNIRETSRSVHAVQEHVTDTSGVGMGNDGAVSLGLGGTTSGDAQTITPPPNSTTQHEVRYIHSLNQVLPPSIRVLGWSPVAADFDARFSCQYRHYKYIFTVGTSPKNDLDAMRNAAARLVGEHDFRNFCKLDPTKQISNYRRRILRATIDPFEHYIEESGTPGDAAESNGSSVTPGLYVFNLIGTAFLYHQVRHIMGVLFLIGAGLEKPDVVDAMFNVEPDDSIPSTSTLPVVDRKPNYRMADALPLILWECGFPESDVRWQNDEGEAIPNTTNDISLAFSGIATSSNRQSPRDISNLFRDLHTTWTRDLIRTSIASVFLQASQSAPSPIFNKSIDSGVGNSNTDDSMTSSRRSPSPRGRGRQNRGLSIVRSPPNMYHLGGGNSQVEARYTPLLERDRGGHIDEMNSRWREGARGKRNMEKMAKKAEERSAKAGTDPQRNSNERYCSTFDREGPPGHSGYPSE